MIMIRPTARGMVMLLATAGCTGAAFVNVNLTTALIASGMMAITASSFILAFFSIHKIDVRRAPNRDGSCGSAVQLPFIISNRSWLWRQGIVVRERLDFTYKYPFFYEAVEALAPYETRLVKRPIPALKRGFYMLNCLDVMGGDPAGFFCRIRKFRCQGEVMIYPEVRDLSQRVNFKRRQAALSINGRPLGITGQGQEFFGVREYSNYDEMRFIHWKSSARHGKLMVKEFEANCMSHIYIILDSERKLTGYDFFDGNLELLIKVAASLTTMLAGMHSRLTFVTANGNEKIRFHGEAVSICGDVIKTLAVLQPGKINFEDLVDEELDRFAYNSIFYCLTMSEPDYLSERLEILIGRGVETRWIYAPRKLFPAREYGSKTRSRYADIDIKSTGSIVPVIANQDTDILKLLTYE
ncbi:MAG: DUF58 domain-containing protein [Victivallales bacterium]|nr:DUF58 domain-containing protein [Victivallales bacterium]